MPTMGSSSIILDYDTSEQPPALHVWRHSHWPYPSTKYLLLLNVDEAETSSSCLINDGVMWAPQEATLGEEW